MVGRILFCEINIHCLFVLAEMGLLISYLPTNADCCK
jgi:hypothetical protein